VADFSIITARLATGARLDSMEDAQQLVASGITHILDLTDAEDDQQFLAGLGLGYLYNPTADDGSEKPAAWWEASLAFAQQAYSSLGTCLLCHCSAGINRGPSTSYAVLRACCGLSSTEAVEMIRAARPQVGLAYAGQFDAYWGTANPGKVQT